MNIAPSLITELKENEIFVFGSNEAGIHGAGAAKQALKWGAIYGQGFGLFGQTFAIPTKNKNLNTLSIGKIGVYVERFIEYTIRSEERIFLVTEIGCGLAYYKPKDIAPLFWGLNNAENIYLPKSFLEVLNGI